MTASSPPTPRPPSGISAFVSGLARAGSAWGLVVLAALSIEVLVVRLGLGYPARLLERQFGQSLDAGKLEPPIDATVLVEMAVDSARGLAGFAAQVAAVTLPAFLLLALLLEAAILERIRARRVLGMVELFTAAGRRGFAFVRANVIGGILLGILLSAVHYGAVGVRSALKLEESPDEITSYRIALARLAGFAISFLVFKTFLDLLKARILLVPSAPYSPELLAEVRRRWTANGTNVTRLAFSTLGLMARHPLRTGSVTLLNAMAFIAALMFLGPIMDAPTGGAVTAAALVQGLLLTYVRFSFLSGQLTLAEAFAAGVPAPSRVAESTAAAAVPSLAHPVPVPIPVVPVAVAALDASRASSLAGVPAPATPATAAPIPAVSAPAVATAAPATPAAVSAPPAGTPPATTPAPADPKPVAAAEPSSKEPSGDIFIDSLPDRLPETGEVPVVDEAALAKEMAGNAPKGTGPSVLRDPAPALAPAAAMPDADALAREIFADSPPPLPPHAPKGMEFQMEEEVESGRFEEGTGAPVAPAPASPPPAAAAPPPPPPPPAPTPRPSAATPRPPAATPRPSAATPRPSATTPRPSVPAPPPPSVPSTPPRIIELEPGSEDDAEDVTMDEFEVDASESAEIPRNVVARISASAAAPPPPAPPPPPSAVDVNSTLVVSRAELEAKAKGARPAPPAPEPAPPEEKPPAPPPAEPKLTVKDIFGDILAELGGELPDSEKDK